MRKLLLLPLMLWACAGAKEPKVETPVTPAALAVGDVVGTYAGTTMADVTDSVLSTWTSVTVANATGGVDGKFVNQAAPTDTTLFTGTISGDSITYVSAPFTTPGAPAGSPQMKWMAVGRATAGAWAGTAVTMVAANDSVVQHSHWTATRTP
jgi:hypothetical protein